MDFSRINLQYLITLRALAQTEPELAAATAGLPIDVVRLVGQLSLEQLVGLAVRKTPIVRVRGDVTWWTDLLDAAHDGEPDGLTTLMIRDPFFKE